jgi:ABC-type branched-subunit amino acid transport system ATPase component
MSEPLLDVQHIVKRFVTADGPITAVDDISFAVGGEFVRSSPVGCGKSTLFNIGGLLGDYENA